MRNDSSDNDIGRQMSFSDDSTKIHRRQYGVRYDGGSKRLLEKSGLPAKSQLELIGMEADDRLDKKIGPWDALTMHEFHKRAELPRNFHEPAKIDAVNGVYIMDDAERQRLEEKLMGIYSGAG